MTQDELKKRLHYDPETGVFTWISGKMFGKTVNYINKMGYPVVHLNKEARLCHRLAFLYMNGSIPKEIDHINIIKSDNRWINLRPANRVIQMVNRGINKNNTSGLKGVCFEKTRNRFAAQLAGKHLGRFKTAKEAYQVYLKAAKERYGEYFREK